LEFPVNNLFILELVLKVCFMV